MRRASCVWGGGAFALAVSLAPVSGQSAHDALVSPFLEGAGSPTPAFTLPPAGERGAVTISESFDGIERLPFLPPPLGPVEPLPFAGSACLLPFDAVYGVVDQAAALSSPAYNGPVGGPDPEGVRGGMLHVQRASVMRPATEPLLSERIYEWRHNLVIPSGPDDPYFVTFDVYKNSHGDFQLFRPISYTRSYVITNILAGGTFAPSDFFRVFSERFGSPEVTEGVVVLGINVMPFETGRFYMNAKQIPEGGWYTIGLLLSYDQMSVWVRDAETRGELASPPSATPVRSGGDFDGQRMFSEYGFGLEKDWAQVYPGLEDDPATPDVIEGYGRAQSDNGQLPFLSLDPNGNIGGEPLTVSIIDALRIEAGLDPAPADVPTYEMRDWWVDEFAIRGGIDVSDLLCVGDFNFDETIDASDLARLLADWGSFGGPEDLNCDGDVDAGDLAILLAAWGPCP